MAKRKAAKAAGRKKKAAKSGAASRQRAAARPASAKASARPRRSAARKSGAKKSAKKARPAARKAPKRAVARKVARKAVARKVARKAVARKAAPRKAPARKAVAKKAPARKSAPSRTAPRTAVTKKVPALNRARRTVTEEDLLPPSPPSSLDMDRTASMARSGANELRERLQEHTEASPAITAGDVDADWESAYAVGDEAPGGDNPTPDQDVVDDIGKALGVQYEDNEELKGEKKISDRDKNRWELDPASAEDYPDHDK